MLALAFNGSALPRTMTRAEWRVVDRWRRVTQKKIAAAVADQIAARFANLVVFGTTHPEIHKHMVDQIVNPPLLVYPEPRWPQ